MRMNPGRSRGPMRTKLRVFPLGLIRPSEITRRSGLEEIGRAARTHLRGTSVWVTRRVLTWNNVQARRAVAGIRAHDDSEVWSGAGAVPLLEWADNGSGYIPGASGGAKGADFSGS